jgi:hypothetical protein
MQRLALAAALTLAVLATPPFVWAADEPSASASAPTKQSTGSASAPLTVFDVVYLETDLREPGLAKAEPDEHMIDWKVSDIGRLMQERAPKVLAANQLGGTVVMVPASAPGTSFDVASVAAGRPVLLLRIDSFKKWKPTLFSTAGTVVFEALLVDHAAGATTVPWREHLGGGLGFDPVLGILKTNRVDAIWVDRILLLALDRLAKKGLVQLADAKAVAPKD